MGWGGLVVVMCMYVLGDVWVVVCGGGGFGGSGGSRGSGGTRGTDRGDGLRSLRRRRS